MRAHMHASQTTASQPVSRAGPKTRYFSGVKGVHASLDGHRLAAARRGRAHLGHSDVRAGVRHERAITLTYGTTQLGRSCSRASRFTVSAKGEGAASGPQPSLDEFNEDVVQPNEEEEPSIEDMLQKKIDEISSTKKTGETLVQAGMFAFERGAYPNAVQLFEESLEYIGPMTEKGGEAQIWLAMSYEACQRMDECIALYTKLETGHASMLIRKQAGELKYIAEAPRLKINRDERVEIPDLSDLERPGYDFS
mmetsp:Transcript_24438/g.53348  ORF Transcript_24438/g.53348 Transcript_24438/m.53348 type:complete len:252 (+) Transcript_24438:178-933(+)